MNIMGRRLCGGSPLERIPAPLGPNPTDFEGADVDLHVLHPQGGDWFDRRYDCFFGNRAPDWGAEGNVDDNPHLELGESDGPGIERLVFDEPESTAALGDPYRVGVHYYRAEIGSPLEMLAGPSEVTVQIFFAGRLAFERTRVLPETNAFWEVGDIVWGPDERTVVEVDRLSSLRPR